MIKAPKGTNDILPEEVYKWNYIQSAFAKLCHLFGYEQIMTPVFEHTELFERGVGDTTDVVQKEMYTFEDKGGRSITLRPEGTASTVRAYLENSLYASPQPSKFFYNIACYRHEKPQAGRLREFHQLGVEVFGSGYPSVDAEIISLAMMFFDQLGIKGLDLNINSIGCPKCRENYNVVLKEYLKQYFDQLCDTCKTRYEKNPLRILDCKSPVCTEIAKNAPVLLDYICEDCAQHFAKTKEYLDALGISYVIDGSIVRGLDYYTKTVFEIKAQGIGAQRTVCGGGRYDGLVELIGGAPTPGMGFALGIERLLLVLEQQGIELPQEEGLRLYIGNIGEAAGRKAQEMVYHLRSLGVASEADHAGRSVKAQMKFANKKNAAYTMILGDNEVQSGVANLKNMQDGSSTQVAIEDLESIAAAVK